MYGGLIKNRMITILYSEIAMKKVLIIYHSLGIQSPSENGNGT